MELADSMEGDGVWIPLTPAPVKPIPTELGLGLGLELGLGLHSVQPMGGRHNCKAELLSGQGTGNENLNGGFQFIGSLNANIGYLERNGVNEMYELKDGVHEHEAALGLKDRKSNAADPHDTSYEREEAVKVPHSECDDKNAHGVHESRAGGIGSVPSPPETNANKKRCNDGIDLNKKPSPPETKDSKKRRNDGIDLNKKPSQRPRMKKHRPKILDEDEQPQSSNYDLGGYNYFGKIVTSKRNTPRRSRFPKECLKASEDLLGDKNEEQSHQHISVVRNQELSEMHVRRFVNFYQRRKKRSSNVAGFVPTLQVHRRTFNPNQCLQNSEKSGPIFPSMFKQQRGKRRKATVNGNWWNIKAFEDGRNYVLRSHRNCQQCCGGLVTAQRVHSALIEFEPSRAHAWGHLTGAMFSPQNCRGLVRLWPGHPSKKRSYRNCYSLYHG